MSDVRARTLHDNDVLALGRLPRDAHGALDCLGTRVGEEKGVEFLRGHDSLQVLQQAELRPAKGNVHLGMRDLGALLLGCLGHGGVAMADVDDTDTAGGEQGSATYEDRSSKRVPSAVVT